MKRKTNNKEVSDTLHWVLLDQLLDEMGAPKQVASGTLSPFGRLQRLRVTINAENTRLREDVDQERRMRKTMESAHGEVVYAFAQLRAKNARLREALSGMAERLGTVAARNTKLREDKERLDTMDRFPNFSFGRCISAPEDHDAPAFALSIGLHSYRKQFPAESFRAAIDAARAALAEGGAK
jgi:hypothetical protein